MAFYVVAGLLTLVLFVFAVFVLGAAGSNDAASREDES